MGLFGFGKKKEEKNTNCCCGCNCSADVAEQSTNECCGQEVKGICCIKVLGAGCKSCHEQYENINKDTSYYVILTFNDTVEKGRGRRLRQVWLMCECCNKKGEWYEDRVYDSDIDW